jgi:DNA-binding MarR family transcriptional regulator
MAEVLKPILGRDGLTNGQFFLLMIISRMPRPTVGWIADELGVRMSTVTHLINDLEGRGLARRERSSEDRRVVRLLVTPRGSKLLGHIEGLSLEQVRAASAGIAARRKVDAAALLIEVAGRLHGSSTGAAAGRSAPKRKSDSPGGRE